MIAIEQTIDTFYAETEESVNEIIDGSDDHLDLILCITLPLNKLSEKFSKVNESLIGNLDLCSDDEVEKQIMPKLRLLNKSCMTLIGAIRTSFLYKDVRTALKNYTKQHDLLLEIMHDILNIRLSKDDEFDNILNDLNAM